jgi:predicted amidohydrolase
MSRLTRRELLGMGLGAGSALAAGGAAGAAEVDPAADPRQARRPEPGKMAVAAVQYRSSLDLAENARRHGEHIRKCAEAGARVVVFPECSLTGFFKESIERATREEIDRAEEIVRSAAREAGVYAVIGSPTRTGAVTYNSAVVIDPSGKVIERYHKVHLAGESWAAPGDHLSVFPVDGTPCSIIVCHDERYPELVRLPVIAGARIVFYISHESDVTAESKIAPYRAQIMARAVENSVFIVHANSPADPKDLSRGSHGQSRLIGPDGNILVEAGIFEEEVIAATFDLRKATGHLARQSLSCPFLADWWREGAARVRKIEG